MLYKVTDGIENVTKDEIDSDTKIVGYVTMEELGKIYTRLDFSITTIRECTCEHDNFRSSMDVYDAYSFGIINIINIKAITGKRDRVGFYIKKNLFLVVSILDEDGSIEAVFEHTVKRTNTDTFSLEKFIYQFFDQLLYNDNSAIEGMGYHINMLEDEVLAGKIYESFNADLLSMKKQLLVLKNYYEQLIDIGEELQENANDLFEEETLRYFRMFTIKVMRLSDSTQMLRDSLVQLREAYEAYVNFNLNQIMKLFTEVTTIFMPLTLIVGWYGMNFTTMPEITWKYGYLFVILLSIVTIAIIWGFFKKKKIV
ncbi:magnesium and cobalt transport protein CorA [Lachnospiraceae bacterium KM106-2]|nr:magnesium and cobalt transport protein CorA [Lachnospiraceae bacterium KM106-2]